MSSHSISLNVFEFGPPGHISTKFPQTHSSPAVGQMVFLISCYLVNNIPYRPHEWYTVQRCKAMFGAPIPQRPALGTSLSGVSKTHGTDRGLHTSWWKPVFISMLFPSGQILTKNFDSVNIHVEKIQRCHFCRNRHPAGTLHNIAQSLYYFDAI